MKNCLAVLLVVMLSAYGSFIANSTALPIQTKSDNSDCSQSLYPADEPMRVVGYLPGYKGLLESIAKVELSHLSHLNLAFANPDSQGNFTHNGRMLCMPGDSKQQFNTAQIQEVVKRAHAADVKVLMSVAGGVLPACAGNWHHLLQEDRRGQLVKNLVKMMTDFNLDGLDIDIEGVLLTQIDQAGQYTPFIQALSAALKPQGKLLTSATASYEGGMIPTSSIPYFDFVNIMSYDAIGPSWGQVGNEHATYQQAENDVKLWLNRGLAKHQLVLGLPFYGYGFGQYNSDYSLRDIAAAFGSEVLQQDVVGNLCSQCSYITYNGMPTLLAKTDLARLHGSGVMIWELSHDLKGDASLLAVIKQQLAAQKKQ